MATLGREPPKFEVWAVNWTIVDLWLTVCTQWRTAPLADGRVHWLGLDYAAVRAGLDLAGRAVSAIEWAGVQLMERAAAEALNGFRG